jgi:hypothetical protein
MKYIMFYIVGMSLGLLLTVFIFTVHQRTAWAEESTEQVELFPGVFITETQWHAEDRTLVYFLLDENVSVMGWTDQTKLCYLKDLASALTPAVYMNGQQVKRLLADIKIIFIPLDKDGMAIGHLMFDKAQYLKWFWHNTL